MNVPATSPLPLPAIYGVAMFTDTAGRTIMQKTAINPTSGFPSMVSEYYAQDVLMLQVQNERGHIVQQQHPYEFKIPDVYNIVEAFKQFDEHRKAGAAAEIDRLKKAQLGRVR